MIQETKPRCSRLAGAALTIGVSSFVLWVWLDKPTPLLGALALALGVGAALLIQLCQTPLKGGMFALAGVGLGLANLLLAVAHMGAASEERRFDFV